MLSLMICSRRWNCAALCTRDHLNLIPVAGFMASGNSSSSFAPTPGAKMLYDPPEGLELRVGAEQGLAGMRNPYSKESELALGTRIGGICYRIGQLCPPSGRGPLPCIFTRRVKFGFCQPRIETPLPDAVVLLR